MLITGFNKYVAEVQNPEEGLNKIVEMAKNNQLSYIEDLILWEET